MNYLTSSVTSVTSTTFWFIVPSLSWWHIRSLGGCSIEDLLEIVCQQIDFWILLYNELAYFDSLGDVSAVPLFSSCFRTCVHGLWSVKAFTGILFVTYLIFFAASSITFSSRSIVDIFCSFGIKFLWPMVIIECMMSIFRGSLLGKWGGGGGEFFFKRVAFLHKK